MKAFDIVAWAPGDGSLIAAECAPPTDMVPEDWSPVFASEEWDYRPCCDCNACCGIVPIDELGPDPEPPVDDEPMDEAEPALAMRGYK
jgi:hypothetical protein